MACSINPTNKKGDPSDFYIKILSTVNNDPVKAANYYIQFLTRFNKLPQDELDPITGEPINIQPYIDEITTIESQDTSITEQGKRRVLALFKNKIKRVNEDIRKLENKKKTFIKEGKTKQANTINLVPLYDELNELNSKLNMLTESILKPIKDSSGNINKARNKELLEKINKEIFFILTDIKQDLESGIPLTNNKLVEYNRILRFLSEFTDYFNTPTPPQEFINSEILAKELHKRILNYSSNNFITFIRNNFPKFGDMQASDISQFIEDSARRAWTLDITRSKNKFIRWLGNFIQDQKRDMEFYIKEKIKELNEIFENLSKEEIDSFFAIDTNGKILRNKFRTFIKEEYYDDLKKLIEANKKVPSTFTSRNIKNFLKNNVIDINPSVVDEAISKNKIQVLKSVIEESLAKQGVNSPEYVEYILDMLLDKNIKFKEAKEQYETYIHSLNINNAEKDRRIAIWNINNDPQFYYDVFLKNGSKITIDNIIDKYSQLKITKDDISLSYKYGTNIVFNPKYLDIEFINKLSDKEYKNKFTSILEFNQEMLSLLPDHVKKETGTSFVYRAKSDLSELLRRGGFDSFLGYMREEFVSQFHSTLDSPYTEIDEATGNPIKSIRINDIENIDKQYNKLQRRQDKFGIVLSQGGLSQEEREEIEKEIEKLEEQKKQLELSYSTDLKKSLEVLVNIASSYKFISSIHSETQLAETLINGAEGITNKDKLQNLKASVEYAIDAMIYGKYKAKEAQSAGSEKRLLLQNQILEKLKSIIPFSKITDNEWSSMSNFFNLVNPDKDESKLTTQSPIQSTPNSNVREEVFRLMAANLLTSRQNLNQAIINHVNLFYNRTYKNIKEFYSFNYQNSINDPEYQEIDSIIKDFQELLTLRYELNKENNVFTRAYLFDFMAKVQQWKSLGWNPFSGFGNLGFGIVSNIIHGAGDTDFNMSDVFKAFTLMLSSTKKWITFGTIKDDNSLKIIHLMDKLGVATDEIDYGQKSDIGSSSFIKKIINSPYEFLKSGDFFIKGITTIAMAMNHKVIMNGTSMSLWEAINPDGTFIDKNNKGWTGSIDNNSELRDLKDFRAKVIDVNKKIHGNFDNNSPVLLKKYILGRLVSQFRLSWLAEGIENRFGSSVYNEILGREVEGRYRTVYNTLLSNKIDTWKNLLYNIILTKDKTNLSPEDLLIRENFRKTAMELIFITAIYSAMSIIKNIAEDDDEEIDPRMRVVVNLLYRVQQDLLFYVTPSTVYELTERSIPAFGVIVDLENAMSGTIKYITDEDYEAKNMALRWTKVFPLISNYNRFNFALNKYSSEQN